MKKEYITSSPTETKKLGEKLGQEILRKKSRKKAVIIGLTGELGSGKTTFLQGFARGLGIKQKILSPTFIIYRKIQIPKSKLQTNSKFQIPKFQNLYHIDCYRIKKPRELLDLGFKEIISDPKNILAIEWAEKIKKILPRTTIWIKFDFVDEKKRKIKIVLNSV